MERQDPLEGDRPDHAAQPEQTEEGFAEGIEQEPRSPAERHVGDFAEGVRPEPHPAPEERMGRFSDGVEEAPETVEKNLEGSFASGVETHPEDRYEEAAEQAALREEADAETPPAGEGRPGRDDPGPLR
jgi:hypothetical protein